MTNEAHATKIQEFDLLRALAIIMLMFHHSQAYGFTLFGFPLEGLTPYFEAILLGIFIFISGYFAQRSFQKENKGSVSFFFSRMLRIYPPYLLAVFLYVTILGITLKRNDLIVYLSGTHFIFAPNYAKPVITIWYIGAIILFYLVFGILLSNLRTTKPLVIVSALVFAAAFALHLWTGLLDERFFKYFIVFLAGILFARLDYFSNWLSGDAVLIKTAIAVLGTITFSLVLAFSSVSPFYILGVVFFIISWIVLLFSLATKIRAQGLVKLAGLISYASYFAYLIHRPLWEWLVGVFSIDVWRNQVFFKLFPASIIVFILSYFLQYGYDRLLAVFRQRK